MKTLGGNCAKGVSIDIIAAEIPVSSVFMKLEMTIIKAIIKIRSQSPQMYDMPVIPKNLGLRQSAQP